MKDMIKFSESSISKEEVEYLKESVEILHQLDIDSGNNPMSGEELSHIFDVAVDGNFKNPRWKELLKEAYIEMKGI